jgi:hypothetical protein
MALLYNLAESVGRSARHRRLAVHCQASMIFWPQISAVAHPNSGRNFGQMGVV